MPADLGTARVPGRMGGTAGRSAVVLCYSRGENLPYRRGNTSLWNYQYCHLLAVPALGIFHCTGRTALRPRRRSFRNSNRNSDDGLLHSRLSGPKPHKKPQKIRVPGSGQGYLLPGNNSLRVYDLRQFWYFCVDSAIVNRHPYVQNPQIINDFFKPGMWQMVILEIVMILQMGSVFPLFMIVSK